MRTDTVILIQFYIPQIDFSAGEEQLLSVMYSFMLELPLLPSHCKVSSVNPGDESSLILVSPHCSSPLWLMLALQTSCDASNQLVWSWPNSVLERQDWIGPRSQSSGFALFPSHSVLGLHRSGSSQKLAEWGFLQWCQQGSSREPEAAYPGALPGRTQGIGLL